MRETRKEYEGIVEKREWVLPYRGEISTGEGEEGESERWKVAPGGLLSEADAIRTFSTFFQEKLLPRVP